MAKGAILVACAIVNHRTMSAGPTWSDQNISNHWLRPRRIMSLIVWMMHSTYPFPLLLPVIGFWCTMLSTLHRCAKLPLNSDPWSIHTYLGLPHRCMMSSRNSAVHQLCSEGTRCASAHLEKGSTTTRRNQLP